MRKTLPALATRHVIKLATSLAAALLLNPSAQAAGQPDPGKRPSSADVLAAAQPGDWREVKPEDALLMELASGPVVIELAREFGYA